MSKERPSFSEVLADTQKWEHDNPRQKRTNTLTENRVWAVLGDSAKLYIGPEMLELVASANEDADEGAEWLPYYKMALSILNLALGDLSGGLNQIAKSAREKGYNNLADAIAENLHRVKDSYLAMLRVVGNGPLNPLTNEDHFAKTEATIAEERARLDAEIAGSQNPL